MAEAARRLNITPTALAQRIRALEDEFHVRLIERSGRTVGLTEGGVRLLARARRFQKDVRELKAAASEKLFAGDMRLGTIATALTGLLPAMLAEVARNYPDLEMYIAADVSRALYHRVVSGELDAALIIEPQFSIPKSLVWRVLRSEPLVVLAPKRLAHLSPLSLLATQPLIRYDRNNWGGWLADRYLQQHGINPDDRIELDTLDAIALLVERGLGVSLVPDWPRAWPLPANVAMLSLPGEVPHRRLGLLWPSNSPYSRLLEEMVTLQQAQQQAKAACGVRPGRRKRETPRLKKGYGAD